MALRYAIAPTTDRLAITLSHDQARIIHAALLDASCATRDRQMEWLLIHENPGSTPDQASEAWQRFKEWEARETAACEAIGIIRATGVELDQQDFGLA